MVMALDLVDGEIFMEKVSQRSGKAPCTCTLAGPRICYCAAMGGQEGLGSGWPGGQRTHGAARR